METDKIRNYIEHHKIQLRAGERGPLGGPRGSGRTQAFLEYAHELVHQGKKVVIITPCPEITAMRYAQQFPGDEPNPVQGVSLKETHLLTGRNPNTYILLRDTD